MPKRTGAVHVVTTRRKYKDRIYETHLLRRSYRDGDKVKNETLGNLSHLPRPVIELIRRSLRGETFVPVSEAFEITRSRPHGHVQAVITAMQRLGFASLVFSAASRERDLVLAMVAARILAPAPAKRSTATLRKVQTRTLDDATPAHNFATLLAELSTIVRNTCRSTGKGNNTSTFDILTTPNAKQRHAFELLQSINV